MIASVFLILLTVIWGYAVFAHGGVTRWQRIVCLDALGVVALAHWVVTRRSAGPPLRGALRWAVLLLPAYVALQLVPLPVTVLEILSPARAELVRYAGALGAAERFAPLSVVPGATMHQFLLVCGYTLLFLLVRNIGWRLSGRIWLVAAPIIVIGVLEAALGLIQAFTGQKGGMAMGTFANHDHYAGLLEMALPFAVMYPISIWRGLDTRHNFPGAPAVKMCVFFGLSAVILLGIINSLSRMGFITAFFSLLVMGTAAWSGTGRKWLVSVALLAAGLGVSFVFLPPDQLIERFSEFSTVDGITSADRLVLWGESLPVFRAFPLFGCGLGGFESVFMRYKVTTPLFSDDYVHNDYLQFLIELGVVGFAIGAILFGCIARRIIRVVASRDDKTNTKSIAIACAGAMAAIGLHTLVDFNLYTPANAMLLAWISGIGGSLNHARRT
jgi:O-antigen ligase